MPITFGWYDETRRIWLQELAGHWTMEDFWQAADAAQQAIEAVAPNNFYIISHLTKNTSLPSGMLSGVRSMLSRRRGNEALHVIVGGGLVVHSFYQIATSPTKQFIRLASSLEEALAIIEKKLAEEQPQTSS